MKNVGSVRISIAYKLDLSEERGFGGEFEDRVQAHHTARRLLTGV
ncbi:MAG: hypothetical protein FMNOHCHN_01934 [Ignavibacteriaceae bacterium]|nr:hypothetical protein [Ignavibacteriaceae bacterium]